MMHEPVGSLGRLLQLQELLAAGDQRLETYGLPVPQRFDAEAFASPQILGELDFDGPRGGTSGGVRPSQDVSRTSAGL